MLINEYVKRWYDESYDIREEEFYMDNAKYVIARSWQSGAIKHGILAAIIAVICLVASHENIEIVRALYVLASLTFAFFLFGVRQYDANDYITSRAMYVMILILMLWTKNKLPDIVQLMIGVAGVVLFVYLTIVKPIKAMAFKQKVKAKIKEEEEKEEQKNADSFDGWYREYKAYREGLPNFDIPEEDPMMQKARDLFKGYTDNAKMLKTRYRQLAKSEHPDNGGDEKMFSCIVDVYEELNMAFA